MVFINEIWVKTNMAPFRGCGPRGARLPGAALFGYRNPSTFSAALRLDRSSPDERASHLENAGYAFVKI